jgi:hypothetical protein
VQRSSSLIVIYSEAETGRIFYSPPRPAPKKVFPAPPRPEKSSPRFAPSRFLKVFLLTALTPKTETERIFYSPLRFATKKVFPASPRPVSSFFFIPASPRPPQKGPRPVSVSVIYSERKEKHDFIV